jgi:hypothetical protein
MNFTNLLPRAYIFFTSLGLLEYYDGSCIVSSPWIGETERRKEDYTSRAYPGRPLRTNSHCRVNLAKSSLETSLSGCKK